MRVTVRIDQLLGNARWFLQHPARCCTTTRTARDGLSTSPLEALTSPRIIRTTPRLWWSEVDATSPVWSEGIHDK